MICTVVIPVSYGEETIGACLEALVRQEGVELNRDYTIVLVNDGSTDGTLDIARRFPISILNMPVELRANCSPPRRGQGCHDFPHPLCRFESDDGEGRGGAD